jgi:hypothetical protein
MRRLSSFPFVASVTSQRRSYAFGVRMFTVSGVINSPSPCAKSALTKWPPSNFRMGTPCVMLAIETEKRLRSRRRREWRRRERRAKLETQEQM